jgi:hypothetical protein
MSEEAREYHPSRTYRWPRQHLDFILPAFKTPRQYISFALNHAVCAIHNSSARKLIKYMTKYKLITSRQ